MRHFEPNQAQSGIDECEPAFYGGGYETDQTTYSCGDGAHEAGGVTTGDSTSCAKQAPSGGLFYCLWRDETIRKKT